MVKRIPEILKEKAQNLLKKKGDLTNIKERWLEELRYIKVKLKKVRTRDARIRNNNLLNEDEGRFYRNINSTKVGKEFVDFWAGIWDDETTAPSRKRMVEIAEKIKEIMTDIMEFETIEKKLHKTLKKRKKAPGVDGTN